jgi:hypothetical protein
MANRKNLPTSQFEISQGRVDERFTRANEIRRDDDKIKELSIGFYDIDNTIKWYFDNVIKPEVNDFGAKHSVPVLYGSPEKWKNIQADGYIRDAAGKIQTPLIVYKRSGVMKNRTLGSKVDANFPQLYYTQEVKYDHQNKYDQFSKLTNSKPIKTYVNTIIPEYVDITYDIIVWTDFIEHMNSIVESIIYSEGSYWGEPERFKFRTKIDDYQNITDLLQDSDRTVRTTFQMTIFGYIVPDVLVKNLSKKDPNKAFDSRQYVFDTQVDNDPTTFQQPNTITVGSQASGSV